MTISTAIMLSPGPSEVHWLMLREICEYQGPVEIAPWELAFVRRVFSWHKRLSEVQATCLHKIWNKIFSHGQA